ncbi:hypothetical protein SAMN05444157_1070 [Frankineae bacterium MT45]|nr:hypothetical protein SAMN05444157_1070 [Frankineae bacterium MT45]
MLTIRRRSKPTWVPLLACSALVCGGLLAAAAPATAAEGPGATDTTTATVPPLPGTNRSVDSWMLAGIPGVAGASAVQIAPQWIATAHHNAPAVGTPFRDWMGTSTIDDTITPAGQANSGGGYSCESTGGPDISFSHLATPIAAPPGGFPSLLSDPIASGLFDSSPSTLPGYVLAAGEGGFIGHIKTVWGTTDNRSVTDPTQGTQAIGGDSGGPAFWYPSATSTPVLANLMVYQGGPFGQSTAQFSGSCGQVADIAAFARAAFATHPTSTAPSYVSLNTVAPPSTRLPASPIVSLSGPGTGTATSLAFDVAALATSPGWVSPAIASYKVTLTPPAGSGLPTASGTISAADSLAGNELVVNGLTTSTSYSVSAVSLTSTGVASRTSFAAPVTPLPAPQSLVSVKTEPYGVPTDTGVDSCVRLTLTASAAGPTPTNVIVFGPNKNTTHSWNGGSPQDECGLAPNKTYRWFVVPSNGTTLAAAATPISFTTAAGTTGTPQNLVVSTGTDNCTTLTWSAPNTPTGGGVLQSYSAIVYNSARGGAGTQEVDGLSTSTTSWRTCTIPGGTKLQFSVFANWDRTNLPGRNSVYTYATTPTAPQALTSVKVQPYGYLNSAGALQTCVQISYSAPVGGSTPTSVLAYRGGVSYTQAWNGQPLTFCGLSPNLKQNWLLVPYNGDEAGVGSFQTFTTPAGVTAAPTP